MAIASEEQAWATWLEFVETHEADRLDALLSDQIVFRAPVYYKERTDKRMVKIILQTVVKIFENFEYHRLWRDGKNWALEFSCEVDGKSLKGIDLVHLDENNQVSEFEVMIRPTTRGPELRAAMEEHMLSNPEFLKLLEEVAAQAS